MGRGIGRNDGEGQRKMYDALTYKIENDEFDVQYIFYGCHNLFTLFIL